MFPYQMVTATTSGITVKVETEYQEAYSSPVQFHYVFTYRITIENHSSHTFQLMSRHWNIADSQYQSKVVDGDGVVGQQPILEPGEHFSYVSGCNLKSGVGKMAGFYSLSRLMDGKTVEIEIPEFTMVVPYRLN